MTILTDIELPFLKMEEDTFAENPFPYFEEARDQHPWLAKCSFGYVVHGLTEIRELLLMDDKMQPGFDDVVELMGAKETGWGRFQHVQLLNLSGDAHKRIREVVAPMFTPSEARRNRGLMQETMTKLLDEWAPKGAFDFEEFISYFPISVMSTMIGASTDDIPNLRSSMEARGLAFGMDKDYMPKGEEGYQILDKHVQKLVSDRRAGHRLRDDPDLLDTLIGAVDDDVLTEREIFDMLIFTYVGGYDTSKNALTFLMHALLDKPDIYARCAEDIDYCTKVVEEGFRYHTTSVLSRLVRKDIVYGDVEIPTGTLLFFPVSVAGRDPSCIENPAEFNPDREINPQNRHLAFGRGIHVCLGQFVARNQIAVGFQLIAQRLKNPRLAGPVGYRPFFGVWGLQGLPIEFDDSGSTSMEQSP